MLLVLLAVLPALGIIFFSAANEKRIHTELVQKDALEVAEATAARLGQYVDGIRHVLLAVGTLPEMHGDDAAACNRTLAKLLTQYPQYDNLAVLRADGVHFASALPFTPGLSLADRPWFKQVVATREFASGEFQIGRVTKKATLNFGYPLKAANGTLHRVLYVPLDLQWLNQQLAQEALPAGAVLTVFDRNGIVLARSAEPEKWMGKNFPDTPLMQRVRTASHGWAEVQGLDGVWRIYAFSTAGGPTKAFYIAVGIPRELAMAHVGTRLRIDLLVLLCVTLLAIVAAWLGGRLFVVQPVRTLIQATDQLAGGDLKARVPMSSQAIELARLGQAFNVMAEALQKQSAEREAATAALRTSEAMLNETGHMAKIGGWEIDLEKGTLTWTRELYAIHEVEEGFQPTVETAINFYAPESRPIIQQAVARAIESGEPFDVELVVITAKGRRIWVQAIGHALLVEGKAQTISGTFQDITERKLADETLRSSEQEQRLLIQNLHAGVVVHASDTQILLANEQASVLLGLTIDQMMGKAAIDPAWCFVREDETPMPLDEYPVNRVLATRVPLRDLVLGINRPGTGDRVWVLVNAFPSFTSTGDLRQIIVTFIDITERKKAEEKYLAQLAELRRWYAVTINREGRVAELKNEVNQLLERLGVAAKYAKAEPARNATEDPPSVTNDVNKENPRTVHT